MAVPLRLFVPCFTFFSYFLLFVAAKPATRIIDDADVPSTTTGFGISYIPQKNGNWNDGGACSPENSKFCLTVIDLSLCQGGTYTATNPAFTSERSIVIDFFGDGISVFFALVGAGPKNYSTICSFNLDNKQPVLYEHIPTEGASVDSIQYRQNVFSTEKGVLTHGRHKLVISVPNATSYLSFDYAEYSFDDEISEPSASTAGKLSPSKATLAASIALGGIIGLIALSLFILYIWHRRKRGFSEAGSRDDLRCPRSPNPQPYNLPSYKGSDSQWDPRDLPGADTPSSNEFGVFRQDAGTVQGMRERVHDAEEGVLGHNSGLDVQRRRTLTGPQSHNNIVE